MKNIPSKKLASMMVGLLVLQFGLGILANLYSTIPTVKPYDVFDHIGFIALHAVNGVILLILGIIFLIRSRKEGEFRKDAVGGLGSIVTAFTFGELFVFTQKDIFSFFMAMAFIGALISYAKIAFSGAVDK